MSKPKFDPSKPFEAVEESKPKFDPSKPFEVPGAIEEKSPYALGDFAQSTLHGVTMGAAPFAGGIGAGLANMFVEPDENMGVIDRFQKGFSEGKQRVIGEEKDLATRNPTAAVTGQVGGALLTAPLTIARGVGTGAKLLNAGRTGAVLGGAHALGHAESGKDAASDIALGSVTNLVLSSLPMLSKGKEVTKQGYDPFLKKAISVSAKPSSAKSVRFDPFTKTRVEPKGSVTSTISTEIDKVADALTNGNPAIKKDLLGLVMQNAGRSALGSQVGYMIGGPAGAAIGAVLSNPASLSVLSKSAGTVAGGAAKVAPYTGIPQTMKALTSPTGQATLRTLGTRAMQRTQEESKGN